MAISKSLRETKVFVNVSLRSTYGLRVRYYYSQ